MGRASWVALLGLGACLSTPDRPADPVDQTRLVAGTNHACAIQSGALYCWGDNHDGQLGVAPSVMRSSASPIRIDGTWRDVAAGDRHTCAVDDQGFVWCWGASDMGQSGLMQATLDKTRLSLPDSQIRARSIFAGGDASCLIDGSSFLYCWGNYDLANPGPHEVTHVHPGSNSASDDAWQDVGLSTQHGCARGTGSQIWCWGLNDDLQLGDPSQASHGIDDAFHVTSAQIASISSGQYGTCGVTLDDHIACWGVRDLTGASSDVSPYGVVTSTASNLDTVVVGGAHACALSYNGDLDCWGRNTHGELGNDYAIKGLPSSTTISNVRAVAAGEAFTCAADDQGIKCWGSDQFGQTGRGHSATVHQPFKVDLGGESAVSVAAGLQHTCAVGASGKVYCWGLNFDGQVVDAGAFAIPMPADSKHTVDASPTYTRLLSLGDQHTCARASATSIDCWGDNANNQLTASGAGVSAASLGGSTFVDFGAGGLATCASTNTNALYCWGNLDGNIAGPMSVGAYPFVSVGNHHAIAVATTNDVAELGSETFCGDTSPLVGASPTAQQRRVYLAQGGTHGCVLDNDNVSTTTLTCWGNNNVHQINSTTNQCVAPPGTWPAPGASNVTVPGGVMWVSNGVRPLTLALGGDHTCAIQETPNSVGPLYCWGGNFEAELGDANDANDLVVSPHLATTGLWREVATGLYHTCALSDAGDVYCWGLNQFGEVGNGDRFPSNARSATPIQF